MKLFQASKLAHQWVDTLRPYCKRIEIAGSVRRARPDVHDIEIVAVPKVQQLETNSSIDMQIGFFSPGVRFKVNWLLKAFRDDVLQGEKIIGGDRLWRLKMPEGINFELYMVLPPAQWGVIFTIRTGPKDFSHWVVTEHHKGGALPTGSRVKDGQLFEWDKLIDTPEEVDFLEEIGLGWINPPDRRAPAKGW